MRHLKSLESLTYEKEQWLNNRHNSKPWWLPCSRPSQHKETLGINSLKQREQLQMPLREYKLRVQEQVERVEPLSTLVPESSKGQMCFPQELDEEVSSWQDWAFIFKNYIGFMDPNYLSEFGWAENHDGPIREDEYVSGSDNGRRAVKLYSVLSSYLKNRPLKILRSVVNNDGCEVWRRLTVELQPTSRSRSLAMAQALVIFPAMSKGTSLYVESATSLPQDDDDHGSCCSSDDSSNDGGSSSSSSRSSRSSSSSSSSNGNDGSDSTNETDEIGEDDQERMVFHVTFQVKLVLSACFLLHGPLYWKGCLERAPAGRSPAAAQALQAESRARDNNFMSPTSASYFASQCSFELALRIQVS